MKDYFILAIETSCDETAIAITKNGRELLANVIASQMDTHRQFGGVVPEIASRKHLETITFCLEEALTIAGIPLSKVDAVAVTQGPGLIGALLIGVVAAKTLAFARDIPLIGTHHIAGHIYANSFVGEILYPSIALVVSGGHTEIVLLEKEGKFKVLGQTKDDAIGEAYDKVARALHFPYPGGPHVDKLACEAGEEEIVLPRAWLKGENYDFSFSGLKSAVLNAVNQAQMKGETLNKPALAKGFQNSVIEVVSVKALQATKKFQARQLLLCGGVAANVGLREHLKKRCALEGISLLIPPIELCTDNAAMVAAAADIKWRHNQFSDLNLKAQAGMSLENWSI